MSKYSTYAKLPPCGSIDSKYFRHPEQFERDINAKKFESELFKAQVRELVVKDPNKIEQRYNEMIEVAIGIKGEFGL